MGLFPIGPRPRAGWTSRTSRARRPWRHSGHDLPSTACVLGRGRVRVWSQVTWREKPGCGTSAALYTPDAFRTRSVRVPYAFRTRSVGICNTFRTSDDQRVLLASLRSVEIRNVLQIPTERVRNAYGTRTERVQEPKPHDREQSQLSSPPKAEVQEAVCSVKRRSQAVHDAKGQAVKDDGTTVASTAQ